MEVDSFDGHHYISSIAPGGPLHTLNLLQPEDELLEVKFFEGGGKKDKQAGSPSQIHKTISNELRICLHDCISDERINNLTGYLFSLGSVCHYLPALC